MAKKKAPARVGITTVEQADKALLKLGQATLELRKLEADAQLEINEIKNRLQRDSAALAAEIERLDEDVLTFAAEQATDLFGQGRKTVDLTFGKLTSRETSKIQIKSVERTVALLKEKEWLDAIVVKENPNKDKLAEYDDEDLKAVGAKRVVEDVISYKLDEERVAREAA